MILSRKKLRLRGEVLINTLLFIAFFFTSNISAQDINLTQFNYSPLFINPANTGNFYGDWRLGLNYRNQWASTGSPYSTAILSGDKNFNVIGQKIGGGLVFINDQSGGVNRNKLYLSGSYSYELNKNYFYGGLQVGLVFGNLATTSWGVWDPVAGDFTGSNGETESYDKGIYPDINLGVIWKRSIQIFEPEVGVSLFHINTPDQSLGSVKSKVPITYNMHLGVKTNINDIIYVLPTGLVSISGNNSVMVAGANAGYRLLGNRSSVKEIFGGLYVRNSDQLNDLNILLGTTVGRLDIVVSYDINNSLLSQSQSTSSFEISLIYKSISTILNSYSIPCERF